MRTPNAWSLTTGVTPPDRPPVFHFISDELRGSQVTHPDMGNFRTVKGDGYQTRALYAGLGVAHHGLSVLSCSIGLGDNDEVQTEGEGQVGTCYNCLGVAVQDGSYYKD